MARDQASAASASTKSNRNALLIFAALVDAASVKSAADYAGTMGSAAMTWRPAAVDDTSVTIGPLDSFKNFVRRRALNALWRPHRRSSALTLGLELAKRHGKTYGVTPQMPLKTSLTQVLCPHSDV